MEVEYETPDESKPLGEKPNLEWLAKDILRVDDKYQRSAKSERSRRNIEKMTRNFSWEYFGAVIVAPNEDGTFNVIDGQHRLLAALGRDDISEVPCVILNGSGTTSRQAKSFSAINTNRVNINSLGKFYAAVAAEDDDAVVLAKILQDAGCEIPRNPVPKGETKSNQTQAVSTLMRLLETYSEGEIVRALSCIKTAYEGENGQMIAPLLKALPPFIRRHKDSIENEDIINVLFSFEPNSFQHDARVTAKTTGASPGKVWDDALERFYATVCREKQNAARR